MDGRQTSDDQEVNGLRKESCTTEIGCCIQEDNCQGSLEVNTLEAFDVCAALEPVQFVFLSNGLDEVGKTGFNVVIRSIDAVHDFACLIQAIVGYKVDW